MRYPSAISRTALVILAFSLLCAPARGAEVANLLLNGGAEQGKDDQPSIWFPASVPTDGLKMTRDRQTAHTGSASLMIENHHRYDQPVANNWGQSLQETPAGQTLVVSGWIKAADVDSANICLQCWDRTGAQMLAMTSTPVVRGDQSDWLLLKSEPVVVPAEAASIIVRAALAGTGKVWFDDLAVTSVAPATEPAQTTPVPSASPGASARGAAIDRELLLHVPGDIVDVLPISADQMVLSYMSDWNAGHVDNIGVANNNGGVRTLFAWPKVDAKYADCRFVLAAYARKTDSGANPPSEIGAHAIIGDWNERTSWDKQPKTADAPATTFKFDGIKGWTTFDITPIVRAQLQDPATVHGVMLRFEKEDLTGGWSGYQFVSREGEGNWESRRPLLLIVRQP